MKKLVNMRLDEKVLGIIESEQGSTFTEKFVNLVFRLDSERKEKEFKLSYLDEQIEAKGKRLKEVSDCLEKVRDIVRRY